MDDGLRSLSPVPSWLQDLIRPERLRDGLVATLPAPAAEAILDCQPHRVRMKKASWAGEYDVTLRDRDTGQIRVVRLAGDWIPPEADPPVVSDGVPFGDRHWEAYLPGLRLFLRTQSDDAELPTLALLADATAACALLETAIRRAGPAYDRFSLRACVPRVLRHKPGSRATLRYDLDYAPGAAADWPAAVIAKTYSGEKGSAAWQGMRALWNSPMRTGHVAIAEPLAFVSEQNLLLQRVLPEETNLKKAIRKALEDGDADGRKLLSDRLAMAAAGLAQLHCCGVLDGPVITWADELAEVGDVIDRLSRPLPAVASAAAAVLDRLAAVGAAHGADPLVPSHGSFRPDQLLIAGDSLGLVDLDGFCQAEPARDLALFRTTVRQLGSGPEQLRQLAEIADGFLAEYHRHMPVSTVRVALWEALDLLTRVLNCHTKVHPDKLREAVDALRRQLAADPLGLAG